LPASDPKPALDRAHLTATSLNGAAIELPARGHVTVIELWATWCDACKRAMPDVERVWRNGSARVVGVATDDNPGRVVNTLKNEDVTYPNVIDADGEVRGWLRVSELPTIVVFDREGRVRWVHRGEDDGAIGDVVASLERE
jgi:thiol-disulfide isomerase/thioredoxin